MSNLRRDSQHADKVAPDIKTTRLCNQTEGVRGKPASKTSDSDPSVLGPGHRARDALMARAADREATGLALLVLRPKTEAESGTKRARVGEVRPERTRDFVKAHGRSPVGGAWGPLGPPRVAFRM